MIFGIDAGNTQITLGCIEGRQVKKVARIETLKRKTEYEYAMNFRSILEQYELNPEQFEGAVICSVVPELTSVLKTAVEMVFGIEALVIGAGIKTGLNIGIDDPAELGGDLVVGAVAALEIIKPPLIIIDMGTATTISVIDKKGRLLGGAIMPGPAVSVEALAMFTSQLPRISLEAPQRCISSNTIDCMNSGAVFGTAASIDGMIDRIHEELGEKAETIVTGGIGKRIAPHCRRPMRIEDDLMLQGLGIIWERNRGKDAIKNKKQK
ncbi:MAG: type III pantothenate kinase [Ruminococcaceae bacterium]|nr:type III pantothenate kinase [Oscillospiraceae bacterium]